MILEGAGSLPSLKLNNFNLRIEILEFINKKLKNPLK